MGHVVFVVSGLVGLRTSSLEYACRLVDAGFRVTFASPDDIGDVVEARGLPFLRLAAPAGASGARRALPARLVRAFRHRARVRAEVDALRVEPAVDAVRRLSPQLVLIDLELHPLIIGARGVGLPVALLSPWLTTWKRPGIAPLHRYVLPGPGIQGAAAAEWAWLRYRAWKALRRRREWVARLGTDRVSVLRALARRVGFRFREEVDFWQWQHPFAYRQLPHLLLNARELDLPHEPPSHLRYVGPMIQRGQRGDADDPTERLLATRDETRPLVYVSFGTFFKGDDRGFVLRALDAVGERPEWDVVLGLGGRVDPDALGPLPDHVHAFPWVPQARLLSRAQAALLHAGISSINECLTFGVPTVVYPLDTNDQMGTAVRVAHHGVGIVGDRRIDDATAIRRKLERVLCDEGIRRRARDMGACFEAYERESTAIEAVQELIRGS